MMITVNIQSTSVICTCSQSVIVQGHFGLWKQVATHLSTDGTQFKDAVISLVYVNHVGCKGYIPFELILKCQTASLPGTTDGL